MRSTYASGLNEMALNDAMLKSSILIHLRNNCYPPFPSAFAGFAFRAVKYARAGQYDRRVRLLKGLSLPKYGNIVPAYVIIEKLRLDCFLEIPDEYENE